MLEKSTKNISSMGEIRCHKKSPEHSPNLEQEVYDYKGLLTANVNLIDIIDSG
jgi:hypothetical protein